MATIDTRFKWCTVVATAAAHEGGGKKAKIHKEQYTAVNNDRTIMHNPTVKDNYNTVFDSRKEKKKMNKKARRKKTIQSTNREKNTVEVSN